MLHLVKRFGLKQHLRSTPASPLTIACFAKPQQQFTPWRRTLATVAKEDLSNVYDVVIVGGGISGTALACSLAASPAMKTYRVALIEAMDLKNTREWSPTPTAFSNRVVSLTPASMEFLNSVGIPNQLHSDRIQPYSKMCVWDGVSDARIEFDAGILGQSSQATAGTNTIAYMIENVHLHHAILKQLDACAGKGADVHVLEKAKVASITLESNESENGLNLSSWPAVQLENGTTLKARLLIGADGVNSPVRNFAKIESLGWDYDRHGVVASLRVDSSRENNTAYQRFLTTGPIALLPLGNSHSSLVWSVPPTLANKLKKLPPADFATLVNAAFRLSESDLRFLFSQIDASSFQPLTDFRSEFDWREDVAKRGKSEMSILERELALPPHVTELQEGTRASFPLRMRNSQHYFADRVALIGDAAHTVHPLAGQGLNQGLLDVQQLTQTIQQGATKGQDISSTHLLQEYASARYLRNLLMISACDKLHRLYSTDFAPLVGIRSLGLSLLNNMDFVKAEIMKYAMGIELPAIASNKHVTEGKSVS